MTTTAQHIAARDDVDLQERLIATAEKLRVPNAKAAVVAALGTLVAQPVVVNGENTTITDVHAYANDVRRDYLKDERALPPGLNPGAVTDDILSAAVSAVLLSGNP